MKSDALAVVVVRLQVPELHAGHRFLLNNVINMHDDVLVVLGESEALLTDKNPLDFETRKKMVQSCYPNVRVTSLQDNECDQHWSDMLDLVVEKHLYVSTDPAIMYGSRDSFLAHYSGRFDRIVLPSVTSVSGTEIRSVKVEAKATPDFRLGVLYATQSRYPTSYQVVDVAVLNEDRSQVLLGGKDGDNGKWRFIGGFVNPTDTSLEHAARREVAEELGIEAADFTYIASKRIEDWRYPVGGKDGMLSAFFIAKFVFGSPLAADDITRAKWFPVVDLIENLVPAHKALGHTLLAFLAHPGSADVA